MKLRLGYAFLTLVAVVATVLSVQLWSFGEAGSVVNVCLIIATFGLAGVTLYFFGKLIDPKTNFFSTIIDLLTSW